MAFSAAGLESDSAENELRRLESGPHASPVWVNEIFSGTHNRALIGNTLIFSVDQTEEGGGWDTAVGLARDHQYTVSELPSDAAICFNFDLNLTTGQSGSWWVGPKISVNWAAMTDAPSSGDWYENYIVEMASQSPSELEANLFEYFDPVFLGETEINGATYRHIKLRYQQWWQYWSIRQDYRESGVLDIWPILDAWTGIPRDLLFDGVKANIETHGPVSGNGSIRSEQSIPFAESFYQSMCSL
ncbi:MAG: hypothetical protein AAFP97_01635 [Pseudomonadota bacterium]